MSSTYILNEIIIIIITNMDMLPAEIINEILLLVDKPSLYEASQVCSQWRQKSLQLISILIV